MYGKHGGNGERELDGKRSLDPAFGFTNHAGNGYLHRYSRQPGHHQGRRGKRPNIDWTGLADLPVKNAPFYFAGSPPADATVTLALVVPISPVRSSRTPSRR